MVTMAPPPTPAELRSAPYAYGLLELPSATIQLETMGIDNS